MYNKVFLIGNLTRDPDLRYTPSGIPVVRFTVAVNRPRKKGTGEAGKGEGGASQDVDFINIVAWRRLAEICGEYLKKGRPVAIEGRLQIRPYEKGGEKKTFTEVLADGMQMLGRKEQGAASKEASSQVDTAKESEELPEESADSEIPF
ncbi:MAG: single-stranded DNA-binding protein [Candidatus Saganbacteria bacterium]|nr:single-stranded DNA-binding protein [Candidatus Saganbacteria bacterium]